MSLPYDDSDPRSIESYAERLLGISLRDILSREDVRAIMNDRANKGEFGRLVEKYYFGYEPNNRPEPDFPKAGLELKATGIIPYRQGDKKAKYHAKERLVLNLIDYMNEHDKEWENSSFWRKNRSLLILFYLYDKGVAPLDFIFKLIGIWEYTPEDLIIIRDDWEKIKQKICDGRAHEISESDTLYLAACRKGSGKGRDLRDQPFSIEKANQRAFSLKQSYVNIIINLWMRRTYPMDIEPIIKDKQDLERAGTFEKYVLQKFRPYLAKTPAEIESSLNLDLNPKAKNYHATLTLRMLGVKAKKAEEFEKADVQVKTIRLKKSGTPDQSMSFPYFKYKEIVEEKWETSTLRTQLDKRFLFVIYRADEQGMFRLWKVMFWSMPYNDLEEQVKKVWQTTVSRVRSGRADNLPKIKDSPVAHVRPHGRDSRDTDETPYGTMVKKQCFWLNASYIKEQIAKVHDR